MAELTREADELFTKVRVSPTIDTNETLLYIAGRAICHELAALRELLAERLPVPGQIVISDERHHDKLDLSGTETGRTQTGKPNQARRPNDGNV